MIEYVERAVAKYPEYRLELLSSYRDADRLYGSDGHRLHYVDGLPHVSPGHFTSGASVEPPNYEAILSRGLQKRFWFTIKKSQHKELMALSRVKQGNCEVKVEVADNTLTISHATADRYSWKYTIQNVGMFGPPFTAEFFLRYFLDAIIIDRPAEVSTTAEHGGVFFSTDIGNGQYAKAVVMKLLKKE